MLNLTTFIRNNRIVITELSGKIPHDVFNRYGMLSMKVFLNIYKEAAMPHLVQS